MIEKYRVHEVAKDLGVASKEVVDLLAANFQGERKSMTALNEQELSVIFNHYTNQNQVESFDEYFAAGRARKEAAQEAARQAAEQARAAQEAARQEADRKERSCRLGKGGAPFLLSVPVSCAGAGAPNAGKGRANCSDWSASVKSSPAAFRAAFRAGSSSGSRWRGRSRPTPISCSPTNPPPRSTCRCARRF